MGYISNLVGGAAVALCLVGATNTGTYFAAKDNLINDAIEGKQITFEEKKKPPYISVISQTSDSLGYLYIGIGKELAEERFRSGEFDAIIKEYKDKASKDRL